MAMNWLRLGEQALWELVGATHGGSTWEWILLGMSVLGLVVVFSRVSQATDIPLTSPGISLLAVLLGIACLIGAWLVVGHWLLPLTGLRVPVPVVRGGVILLSLVMTVPGMCLILRAHVHSVLMAWGAGLLAAVLILWLGGLSLDMVQAGSKSAERTKARSMEMQDFLNKQ